MHQLRHEAIQLALDLAQVRDEMADIESRFGGLMKLCDELFAAADAGPAENLENVQRHSEEQRAIVAEVQKHARYPGFQADLERIALIGDEKIELTEKLLHGGELSAGVLAELQVLEKRQLEILRSRTGRFEGLGLERLFSKIVRLSEIQEFVLRELHERAEAKKT